MEHWKLSDFFIVTHKHTEAPRSEAFSPQSDSPHVFQQSLEGLNPGMGEFSISCPPLAAATTKS